MNPLELYEAYSAVYAPQEVDEEERPLPKNKMFRKAANLGRDVVSPATSDEDRQKKYDRSKKIIKTLNKEEFDVFDVVLEFLYVEGYAETLEEAEWMMANIIDEEAIAIVLGEAITSEKGKAKAAEMIAKRTTASGRAKPGQGDNVATIKHIGRSNRDGLLGTPPNRKVAGSNWPKSYSGIGGTGNKAARRAGTYKEEFELWVNELVEEGYNLSDYTWDDMFDIYEADSLAAMQARREKRQKANMKKHGTPGFDYSKPPSGKKGYLDAITKKEEYVDEAMSSYDRNRQRAAQRAAARNAARKEGKTGAVPGVGYVSPRSERETYRDSAGVERHTSGARMPKNEEYMDESQYARENPEKYEREQAKKSAPVRGEKTPMPPRGDKRREDFEKWYAKNVR
jgi:hypothetical protein